MRHCGLPESKAAQLLERVAGGVAHSIAENRRYIAQHPDFGPAGTRVIQAFERGLERSIAATSLGR